MEFSIILMWISLLLISTSTSALIMEPSSSSRHPTVGLALHSTRLDYVHGYHAGNYADVVKHSVLIMLLEHMKRKDSPFVYVDTHAGAGSYPLDSEEALQLGEFRRGVGRLLETEDKLPDPLPKLVEMTRKKDLSVYPGSPMIAKELCRSQDSMLLFEKAQDIFDLLSNNINNDATIIMQDGYKGLADHAWNTKSLPRALVFIDPPYQDGSDTDQAARVVKHLSKHWQSARVALWYPASDALREKSDRLLSELKKATSAEILALEMYPSDAIGTGIVLVNPSYGIEEDLRCCLPEIAKVLRDEKPTLRLKWL